MAELPLAVENGDDAGGAASEALRGRLKNLDQHVVRGIIRRVEEGELKSGDKLPSEAALMRGFGVSRTVIREALAKLQASGVVETRHGVGTFVRGAEGLLAPFPGSHSPVTIRDVIAIVELRVSLETETAALAAVRAMPEQIAAMRVCVDEFARCIRERDPAIAQDKSFHLEIAKATQNKYFESILMQIGEIIPRAKVDSARLSEQSAESYLARTHEEHLLILQAIANKDQESARAAMRVHLNSSRNRLCRALELMEGAAEPTGA